MPPDEWGKFTWVECKCDEGLYCHPTEKRCFRHPTQPTRPTTEQDLSQTRPTTGTTKDKNDQQRTRPTTPFQQTSEFSRTSRTEIATSKHQTSNPAENSGPTTTPAPTDAESTAGEGTLASDCERVKQTTVCTDLLDVLEFSSDPALQSHYDKYCEC